MVTIPYFQSQRMIDSGILQPIDTSRLTNWDDLFPGLRDNSGIRDSSGQVFGVPLVWGDGPFVYAPERVENLPVSYLELADPEWKDRFVIFDDPMGTFYMTALALGFSDAPLLTHEQLAAVAEQAKPIVANVGAFANGYQDATDRMVAGDMDLNWPGWEAQQNWGADKGVTLDFNFFEESAAGWWDGLAIPTSSENSDCVYEYLDAIISPELNADVANNLASGPSNSKAESLVSGISAMYDYTLVSTLTDRTEVAFKSVSPPEEPPEGIASMQNWLDTWQEVKAG
jgi:spermidine/putrescine-binding protein